MDVDLSLDKMASSPSKISVHKMVSSQDKITLGCELVDVSVDVLGS